MKLVTYLVKESELNIHSTNQAGARLGWLINSWIIDIGFAQQWLVYYRQFSSSLLLPLKLNHSLAVFNHLHHLRQIYQLILNEDWSTILIHGEPVSIPVQEVQLLSPLLEGNKLMTISSEAMLTVPSSIIWPNMPIVNSSQMIPGLAFTAGRPQQEWLGCCLIHYWLKDDARWIPSLGPYLWIASPTQCCREHWWVVRRNGKVVHQKEINPWVLFLEMNQNLNDHHDGKMIGTIFSSSVVDVQPGDQIETEMEHLGRLQNRVDKT